MLLFIVFFYFVFSFQLFAQLFPVNFSGDDSIELKAYGSFECGYTNNRALYATFGYERQLWTCRQAILGFEGEQGRYTIFRLEFVPIYESIKTVIKRVDGKVKLSNSDVEKYQKDGIVVPNNEIHRLTYDLVKSPLENGRILEVDGSSEYVNWYKNQGSRLYYLEDYPIREMYLGWLSESKKHTILVGRMKNLLSFDERRMIWLEDAWFAPMSYWLSKEIYSGISYVLRPVDNFTLEFAIFSGDGNPTKNGMYYIDNSGSPNKKTNNTPILEFNLKNTIDIGNFNGSLFFGMERGTIGSTYDVAKEEGKHNKNILATGFDVEYHFNSTLPSNLRAYFQYTRFTSGLREKSSQKTEHPLFRDIVQNGFFIGIDIAMESRYIFRGIKIGLAYEMFDRYDYSAHLYSVGKIGENEGREGKECLKDYMGSKQNSFIINADFFISKNICLTFGAHFSDDPLFWISDVLGSRGSNRYKISLAVNF